MLVAGFILIPNILNKNKSNMRNGIEIEINNDAEKYRNAAKGIFDNFIEKNLKKYNIRDIIEIAVVSSEADGYGRYRYSYNIKCFIYDSNIATDKSFSMLYIPLDDGVYYSSLSSPFRIEDNQWGEPLTEEKKDVIRIKYYLGDSYTFNYTVDVSNKSDYKLIIDDTLVVYLGDSTDLISKLSMFKTLYEKEFKNNENQRGEIIVRDYTKPIVRTYE